MAKAFEAWSIVHRVVAAIGLLATIAWVLLASMGMLPADEEYDEDSAAEGFAGRARDIWSRAWRYQQALFARRYQSSLTRASSSYPRLAQPNTRRSLTGMFAEATGNVPPAIASLAAFGKTRP